MKPRTRNLFRIAMLLAASACLDVIAAPAPQRPADQFIVRYRAQAAAATATATTGRQALLDTVGRTHGVRLQPQRRLAIGAEVVRADRALDAEATKKLLMQLEADPRVASAQVDRWMSPAFTPNDAYFAVQQWNLNGDAGGIRSPLAWDSSAGYGVVVGVVDTGVAAHPDLDANVTGGYDFISDPATAGDGDGRDPSWLDPGDFTVDGQCGFGIAGAPSSWHGTKNAGVIAAVTNNGSALAGVAFNARVMALRALGRCGGRISDIADAIVWAAGGAVPGIATNPNPVEVLNLSFSGLGACDPAMQAAIDTAANAGVVVVAAAGNRGGDVASETPGSCANVIVVGASDNYGGRAPYSNFGAGIDLVAPGGVNSNLYVLSNSGQQGPGSGMVGSGHGTSLAAAHVSGVAAQMQALQVNPPETVAAILRGTARTPSSPCPGCGAGIVDASYAVGAARGPVVFMLDPPVVDEGNTGTKTVTFTLRLSQALATPVTFDLATVDVTATAGSDYDALSLTGQAFAPGEVAKTYSVTVRGDTTLEANETFALVASNLSGAAALDARGDATIRNDDAYALQNGVPVPGLSGAYHSEQWFVIDVPAGTAELVIASTGGSGDMDLYIYFGSRTGPWLCSGTSGLPTETCRFTNPQAGRYFIRMYAYSAYAGITLTATYGYATLSIDDLVLVENDAGSKLVSGTVRLAYPRTVAVTVDVELSSGTATLGTDFTTSGVTGIRFEPGQQVKYFDVTIVGDTAIEPNEAFHMTLVNPAGGGAVLGDAVGDVVILNNDGPTLRVGSVALGEGNAGTKVATFTVSLSQAAAVPVTYSISTADGTALAGNDYVAASLVNETIPAGMLARTFSVTINGDTTVELNETFAVRISQVTGASILQSQAVGTLLNDDGLTLSVLDASVAEGNSSSRAANVTVRLSQPASNYVYFTLTSRDQSAHASDYYNAYFTTYIAPGETTKVLQVYATGDTTPEPNETFEVNLSNVSGASVLDPQGIVTIYNDDGPTLAINDVAISEGNSGTKVATFTVLLSQAAAVPITYDIATSNLTATAGSDYVATSLAGEAIPAGQLSKTFTVTLNGDTAVEANETFRVTVSNISAGATLIKHQGTGTITNDD